MIIRNNCGLSFEFLPNGNIRHILAGTTRIGLNEVSPSSMAASGLFLRKRGPEITFTPLLGPESHSRYRFSESGFIAEGSWEKIHYILRLVLAADDFSWQWNIQLHNTGTEAAEFDVVYLQDVGLKNAGAGFQNEYYVSQYLEHLVFDDAQLGKVICCRQNMKEEGRHPWLILSSARGAASASTDGLQFFGPAFRDTAIPAGLMKAEAEGALAAESSVTALCETPFLLESDGNYQSFFMARFLPDHPAASSTADLALLTPILSEIIPASEDFRELIPEPNLFTESARFHALDLREDELTRFFGEERRHAEVVDGQLLSFFSGTHAHVVLKAKEIRTARPHGHILQAQGTLTADESLVSTTCWAFGVFNAHLTQGNTNFNILLSVCANPFHTVLENGQRIIIESKGKHYLLGVPSAFEMGLNYCRWIYKNNDHCLEVRTWTSKQKPVVNLSFRVLEGNPVGLRLTHQFDPLNQWKAATGEDDKSFLLIPAPGSMITEGYPEARFRLQCSRAVKALPTPDSWPLFVLEAPESTDFHLRFIGEVTGKAEIRQEEDPDSRFRADHADALAQWKSLSMHLVLESKHEDIRAIREILPWYGMNALTHYLSPHGLEQFGGAAWGTRDVTQGPFDLLLTTGHYTEARKLLLQIFSHQNPDGGWPQWWMFDRYARIRAHEAHGDILYWCILSLAAYLTVTGDSAILDEQIPYYTDSGPDSVEHSPLAEHLDRLIQKITGSFLPGTAFVPFGGGDWNDSLQPLSQELAEKMISSWTVEMNYQAFMQMGCAYQQSGRPEKAAELRHWADRIKEDFNRWLIRDGQVCGYGISEPDGSIRVLLHPDDRQTPIRYSLLPMNRGIISGIFSTEQAKFHQEIVESRLKGPDGARLMDQPLPYRGGIQEIFQRAESSTYFGREIGLMYIHEHIRYAESLAVCGKAGDFIKALRQAVPVEYRNVVPMGDLRQANCYYSSSDVVFSSRYEAAQRYPEVLGGKLPLSGGWRVYSSGPGIFITLIIRNLLGFRVAADTLILDPVIPASFDGLRAGLLFEGFPLEIRYTIRKNHHSPERILLNGRAIPFTLSENPYRTGGAVLDKKLFMCLLRKEGNEVEVEM